MATYMQMLQNQQGGWNAVQVVDRALTNRINREVQQDQFNQNLQVRATEFNRQMNLQEAQFDELKRNNLLEAQNLRFANEMKWMEFQADQQLAPIRLEAAKVQLETAKIANARNDVTNAQQQFNFVTKPFDQSVASYLSQVQDPRYGQAYLEIKQRALTDVGSGKNFNPAKYQQEIDMLNESFGLAGDPNSSQFGTMRSPTSEYSPQVSQLLRDIGAPEVAVDYERFNNPSKKLEQSSLRVAGLLAGDNEFPAVVQGLQLISSPEEVANYGNLRIGFRGLTQELELMQKERAVLNTQLAQARGTPQEQSVRADISELDSRIAQKKQEKDNIYRQATGLPQPAVSQIPTFDPIESVRRAIENDTNNQSLQSYNIQPPTTSSSFSATLQKKQSDNLASVLQAFPDETMQGTTWGYLAGKNVKTRSQDVKHIRSDILKNVKALSEEEIDRRIENLKLGKGKDIIENYSRGIETFSTMVSPGISTGGMFGQRLGAIFSVEDAIEFLEDIPDNDPRKRIYKETIYAQMISNAMIGALSE